MPTRTSLLACVLPLLPGCAAAPDIQGGPGDVTSALQVSSSAFVSQQQIPAVYTCDGDEVSPPLHWSQVPSDARSLVLIVDDPDAQSFTHWLLYNLPPSVDLPEAAASHALPRGAAHGQNDGKTAGYAGPCPPRGRHHYSFKLYALDTFLTGLDNPTRQQVDTAMQGHILASGELVGIYARDTRQ